MTGVDQVDDRWAVTAAKSLAYVKLATVSGAEGAQLKMEGVLQARVSWEVKIREMVASRVQLEVMAPLQILKKGVGNEHWRGDAADEMVAA